MVKSTLVNCNETCDYKAALGRLTTNPTLSCLIAGYGQTVRTGCMCTGVGVHVYSWVGGCACVQLSGWGVLACVQLSGWVCMHVYSWVGGCACVCTVEWVGVHACVQLSGWVYNWVGGCACVLYWSYCYCNSIKVSCLSICFECVCMGVVMSV